MTIDLRVIETSQKIQTERITQADNDLVYRQITYRVWHNTTQQLLMMVYHQTKQPLYRATIDMITKAGI